MSPSIFKPTRQLCAPASSTSNRFRVLRFAVAKRVQRGLHLPDIALPVALYRRARQAQATGQQPRAFRHKPTGVGLSSVQANH
jgi:hypothetical protein